MTEKLKVEKCEDKDRKLKGFKFGDQEFYGRFAFQEAKKAEQVFKSKAWEKNPAPLPKKEEPKKEKIEKPKKATRKTKKTK